MEKGIDGGNECQQSANDQIVSVVRCQSQKKLLPQRSSKSGLVRNLAKKYSLPALSSTASGSRFRFNDVVFPVDRLPMHSTFFGGGLLYSWKNLVDCILEFRKIVGQSEERRFREGKLK